MKSLTAKGLITIEGVGQKLRNPTMEIINVNYDCIKNTINIECLFCEGKANFKHSRYFSFQRNKGSVSEDEVMECVVSHKELSLFS